MNRVTTLCLAAFFACSPATPNHFTDFGTGAPTTVRIKLVDTANPAVGVPVTVVDPGSNVLARALTNEDGVAELTLSSAGHGWLVGNDGRGRGTLVRLTSQPSGLNDLGERPLRELTEFPELVTLRGVDFEERLTGETTHFAASFVLAEQGRTAVALQKPVLSTGLPRIVAVDLATGATRVLAEARDVREPFAPEAGDWVVWNEAGETVVFDLPANRELARFQNPPGVVPSGAGWRFGETLSLLFFDPDPSFTVTSRAPVGVIISATGRVTQRALLPMTGETWATPAARTLWVRRFDAPQIVVFDAATFEPKGELMSAGMVVSAGDDCAFVNQLRPEGNVLVRMALGGASTDLAVSGGSNWLAMGQSGAGQFLFRSLPFNGAPTKFALATCSGPGVELPLPGAQCGASCLLDATVENEWRLTSWEDSERTMSIWRWIPGEETELLYRAPSSSGGLNYEGGTPPLVIAPPLTDPAPQLWLGLPGDSTPRTWLRAPRPVWRRTPDGQRVVYLMRDPLTEAQQLFQLEVAP